MFREARFGNAEIGRALTKQDGVGVLPSEGD